MRKKSFLFGFLFVFLFFFGWGSLWGQDATLKEIREIYYKVQNKIKEDPNGENPWIDKFDLLSINKTVKNRFDDGNVELMSSTYRIYMDEKTGNVFFATISINGSDFDEYEEFLYDDSGNLIFYYYTSSLYDNKIYEVDEACAGPVEFRCYFADNKPFLISIKLDGEQYYEGKKGQIPEKYNSFAKSLQQKAEFLKRLPGKF